MLNPLLTKLVHSRWLNVGLVLFLRVYEPLLLLRTLTPKKELGQYPAILTSHLISNQYRNITYVMENVKSIRKRTSEFSETYQQVNKDRTKHFPCCNMFIS